MPLEEPTIEFSLNGFTKFSEIDDNISVIKVVWKCNLLCKRPRCYHSTRKTDVSASKTQVREGIFKLTPLHVSVIYQIPWICWIHWISLQFWETSNRVFHKFPAIQKCQYCQLFLGVPLEINQTNKICKFLNIILFSPLISNFTLTTTTWCK